MSQCALCRCAIPTPKVYWGKCDRCQNMVDAVEKLPILKKQLAIALIALESIKENKCGKGCASFAWSKIAEIKKESL